VVADHGHHFPAQFAGALAQQQIVQAMIVLGDEHHDALAARLIEQAVLHLKAFGELTDRALQGYAIRHQLGQIEAQPLKEQARDAVGVLVRIEDVGAMPVQHLRQRRDDAATIRARDQQRREARNRRH
jgi:hypothetical protein